MRTAECMKMSAGRSRHRHHKSSLQNKNNQDCVNNYMQRRAHRQVRVFVVFLIINKVSLSH